jgi:hypothetical protein
MRGFAVRRNQSAKHGETRISPKANTLSSVREALHTLGQPLGSGLRSMMETRFGHDFSRVRVHADNKAAEASRAVNAAAFTLGHDIVFARGRYSPESVAGRNLLLHELVHVMQQRNNSTPLPQHFIPIGDANDRFEKYAAHISNSSSVTQVKPDPVVEPHIQRQVDPAQPVQQAEGETDEREKYRCLGALIENEKWRYDEIVEEFSDVVFSGDTLGKISRSLEKYRGAKLFTDCTCCGEIVSNTVREVSPGRNWQTNYPPNLEDPHIQSLGERTVNVRGGQYTIELHIRMDWGSTASCGCA